MDFYSDFIHFGWEIDIFIVEYQKTSKNQTTFDDKSGYNMNIDKYFQFFFFFTIRFQLKMDFDATYTTKMQITHWSLAHTTTVGIWKGIVIDLSTGATYYTLYYVNTRNPEYVNFSLKISFEINLNLIVQLMLLWSCNVWATGT